MKDTTEILKKSLALLMAVIMTVGSCGCGTTYYASEEAQGEYEINALAEPKEETVALNYDTEEEAAPEEEAGEAEPAEEETVADDTTATLDIDGSQLTIPEGSDATADVDTADMYFELAAGADITGEWAKDVAAIARSQTGYAESAYNYAVDGAGNQRGYTLYGRFFDTPYGAWNAMFAAFCVEMADVQEFETDKISGCWAEKLAEADQLKKNGEYEPKEGDVIFFDFDADGNADGAGIVTAVSEGIISTVEGGREGRVAEYSYAAEDQTIFGYGEIPENPELAAEETEAELVYTEQSLTAEASDGAVIVVEGRLPEGTELAVTVVSYTAEEAAELLGTALEDVTDYFAYDISLLLNGAEFKPEEEVSVLITPPADFTFEEITVVHIEDDGSGSELEAEFNGESVAFSTGSFSVFMLGAKTDDTDTIEEGETTEAAFTNTRNIYGKLKVTNEVTGNSEDKDKDFNFRVELEDTTVNGQHGDMFFENGVASFTLKDGGSKTATDLPAGTTYTVTEANSEEGFETSVNGREDNTINGQISGNIVAKALFSNVRNGSFELKKTLNSWHETQGSVEFIYKVTGDYNDKTVLDNVYGISFTGAGTKSITIGPLPNGTDVTVVEVYEGGSYRLNGDNRDQSIEIDAAKGNQTVEFENTYDNGLTPSNAKVNDFLAQDYAMAHKVTYVVNPDPTYGTPEGSAVPTDPTEYRPGDTVNVAEQLTTSVDYAFDAEGKEKKGTWWFESWDKDDFQIYENTTITGGWTFIVEYKVTYVVNPDPTYGTPERSTVPTDSKKYLPGEAVHVAGQLTPEVDYAYNGKGEKISGTWTFTPWDKGDFEIYENTTITGGWTFKPAPLVKYKYTVHYVLWDDYLKGKTTKVADDEDRVIDQLGITVTEPAKTGNDLKPKYRKSYQPVPGFESRTETIRYDGYEIWIFYQKKSSGS